MGPMQMKLLNEIEKSMRLKENGMNIASVVTLQEACVEAARDVNEYISPLCDATVHITIGVLRYVADLLEEEGGDIVDKLGKYEDICDDPERLKEMVKEKGIPEQ